MRYGGHLANIKQISSEKVEKIVDESISNPDSKINTSITEVVKTINGANHESYLIENTIDTSETIVSSWSVLPYAEQVGEFKAVVLVRNKTTNTIVTAIALLSFDYTSNPGITFQSDLLTNAAIDLAVGVNVDNVLYATVSDMTTDAKRIHFCFERCVLSKREWLLSADFNMELCMDAVVSSYLNFSANMGFGVNMSVSVSDALSFILSYNYTTNGVDGTTPQFALWDDNTYPLQYFANIKYTEGGYSGSGTGTYNSNTQALNGGLFSKVASGESHPNLVLHLVITNITDSIVMQDETIVNPTKNVDDTIWITANFVNGKVYHLEAEYYTI